MFVFSSSRTGRTEVKPPDPGSLNEQSSLEEKVQEEAHLGKITTSAEEAVEEESVSAPPLHDKNPEAEDRGKFTVTNPILMVIPTTHVLVLLLLYVLDVLPGTFTFCLDFRSCYSEKKQQQQLIIVISLISHCICG